jgi:hypothetical protein
LSSLELDELFDEEFELELEEELLDEFELEFDEELLDALLDELELEFDEEFELDDPRRSSSSSSRFCQLRASNRLWPLRSRPARGSPPRACWKNRRTGSLAAAGVAVAAVATSAPIRPVLRSFMIVSFRCWGMCPPMSG